MKTYLKQILRHVKTLPPRQFPFSTRVLFKFLTCIKTEFLLILQIMPVLLLIFRPRPVIVLRLYRALEISFLLNLLFLRVKLKNRVQLRVVGGQFVESLQSVVRLRHRVVVNTIRVLLRDFCVALGSLGEGDFLEVGVIRSQSKPIASE